MLAFMIFPVTDEFRGDTEGKDRTAAVAAGFQSIEQFIHPSGTGTVFRADEFRFSMLVAPCLAAGIDFWTKFFEHLVERSASGQDDRRVNEVAFVKRTKRIQVTIKSLVLAIPFEIKRDALFHVIDLMPVEKVFDFFLLDVASMPLL